MAGKKAHKPRNIEWYAGNKATSAKHGAGKTSISQTPGESQRDPKRRRGQYGGAGNPPLIKK